MGVAGIWGSSAKSLQGVDGSVQTLELDLETREKDPKSLPADLYDLQGRLGLYLLGAM